MPGVFKRGPKHITVLGDKGMKHHKPVTRKPELSQISNFAIWKDFLLRTLDQVIEIVFILTR